MKKQFSPKDLEKLHDQSLQNLENEEENILFSNHKIKADERELERLILKNLKARETGEITRQNYLKVLSEIREQFSNFEEMEIAAIEIAAMEELNYFVDDEGKAYD